MKNHLIGLTCWTCGAVNSDMEQRFRCSTCDGFLSVAYDMNGVRRSITPSELSSRRGGVWRFAELLPIRDEQNIVSLGEGGAPLILSRRIGPRLGLPRLYFKDLTRNPTYSFKDYSSTVTLSKAREIGAPGVAVLSAGNGASSIAAYAAAAGLPARAYVLPNSYAGMITQCMMYGAQGRMLSGLGPEVWPPVIDEIRREGLMDTGVPINPYRAEGKKIIGYEIAEALGWSAPAHIICPTAGGASLLGLGKAFAEMKELGWIDAGPSLHCVQHESCDPVVQAWKTGKPVQAALAPQSVAIGLLAPNPAAGNRLVDIIATSGGGACAVDDGEIVTAQLALAAEEGLYVEPSSAAALAGLQRLLAAELITPNSTIVLLLTGSGLKASEISERYAPKPDSRFGEKSGGLPSE